MARRRNRSSASSFDTAPIIQLWIFRLLVQLGTYRKFIGHAGFSDDSLAEALGLGKWVEACSIEFEDKVVTAEVRKRHREFEQEFAHAGLPGCLQQNVARLANLVGLTAVDCRILEFAVLIHSERLLDDAADMLGHLSSTKVFHVLSCILALPESEIRASLSQQGLLARSGLVSLDRSGTSALRYKLDLLSDKFADHICCAEADPFDLLRDTVALAAAPELSITDYQHVNEWLALLRPYLRQALATGRKGVNILLHGAPGTGKSQLTKALAHELACDLFEVASEDVDGAPVQAERRLRAFRAAQCFFAHSRAILLFDEVEDVFCESDGLFASPSVAQKRKAWINRTLESNAVPTFWVCNSIRGLDPAFIRRFDIVFELPIPPKKQREVIIQKACTDMLDAACISRLADSSVLAPAVVTRAASVVQTIRDQLGAEKANAAIQLLIGNTLEAQGHAPIRKHDPSRLPEIYDPAFIHADADLEKVTAGLIQARSGRLCLYGPPGTGKTAYGRWLAERLEAPLLIRRASDLMGMYVGESEKNIAAAFRRAERDNAVLLIDEVDSFLQDRRGAQSNWEVTLVNEMLTQMEAFPGIFIASTNLMSGLDQAALRRFDLKVKFDFLNSDQTRGLLQRYCAELGLAMPTEEQLLQLMRLDRLTPGDFAAVARRSRFHSITSAAALVDALESETQLKEGAKIVIGFI